MGNGVGEKLLHENSTTYSIYDSNEIVLYEPLLHLPFHYILTTLKYSAVTQLIYFTYKTYLWALPNHCS